MTKPERRQLEQASTEGGIPERHGKDETHPPDPTSEEMTGGSMATRVTAKQQKQATCVGRRRGRGEEQRHPEMQARGEGRAGPKSPKPVAVAALAGAEGSS